MSTKLPTVSIIINCFNGSRYLKQALASVVSQKFKDWELVFWDNCSEDASISIVEEFRYSDPRIKVYRALEHTTLGEARNLALQKASGEWVAFLDCDDLWLDSKLDKQVRLIESDVGLIYSRMQMLIEPDADNTIMKRSAGGSYPKLKRLPQGNVLQALLRQCFIGMPTAIIRKSILLEAGGIDIKLKVAEDYDMFLKVASKSNVLAVDEDLAVYRVHSSNLSHNSLDLTFMESISLIKKYNYAPGFFLSILLWKLRFMKSIILKNYRL